MNKVTITNAMRDKKIWVFNGGTAFEGNPKWLFLYVVNHRPDITPYWFCYDNALMDYMHKLGYKACLFDSAQAEKIGKKAGVYVVNQFKELMHPYLLGATVLNLWHGVGCKTIEKGVHEGILNERIAKKHIRYTDIYQKYYLFLVTSPMMEQHFIRQCTLSEDHLIRAGYPCNTYPDPVASYDHDLKKGRNLPDDTRIVAYVPTYRDYQPRFMGTAFPDMERLVENLRKNHILLILKLHPKMENDPQYLDIYDRYKDDPNLLFWDPLNDFYEVFDQVDTAIIDYSSIFYDMLAGGVKHFIRYIFDYDDPESMREFAFDYLENTVGTIAKSFDELLNVLGDKPEDMTAGVAGINEKFWAYSVPDTCEKLVNSAIDFVPDEEMELPTLYSYDIFDTLITREFQDPKLIIKHVQMKLRTSTVAFPDYVVQNYHKIRPWCEANCREYYNKTLDKRTHTEISYEQIFRRMQELFELTDEQIDLLMLWEMEAEYRTIIPIPKRIQEVKDLVEAGETVLLISDMYLPKKFIQMMLEKCDPFLNTLPLFLSSDCGFQKTKKALFLEAYHSVEYRFGEWLHTGDSKVADQDMPRKLSIKTRHVDPPFSLTPYERKILEFGESLDLARVSGMFARVRMGIRRFPQVADRQTDTEHFAFEFASMYFVPYVYWAVDHAVRHGMDTAYFISRDGHYLKNIADAIIEERGLKLKTKYIYGSRRLWRVPSMIDSIDEEFFGNYGNLAGIKNFKHLLDAADISQEKLLELFPEMEKYVGKVFSAEEKRTIISKLSNSQEYREYLLEQAAKERVIIDKYLKQEIDFSEKYCFIEYWGRGYTQTCLARLIWNVVGEEVDNIFYYARSIYPNEGHIIRRNFSGNNYSLIFVEAIFANLPYRSIDEYAENEEGKVVPVKKECDYDEALYHALDTYMPLFARMLCNMDLDDPIGTMHALYDFGLSYFHGTRKQKNSFIIKHIGHLHDSPYIYGDRREYAPPVTMSVISDVLIHGREFQTSSIEESLTVSKPIYSKMYTFYKKHVKKHLKKKKKK